MEIYLAPGCSSCYNVVEARFEAGFSYARALEPADHKEYIMILLQANNIEKSFGARPILRGASLVLNERERVGMVGANGSGKSTFLQCLTGRLAADSGICSQAAFTAIGYLEQLPGIEPRCSAWDAVMAGFPELLEQRAAIGRLEQEISQAGKRAEALLDGYARITEAYDRANGYACEATARRVLSGLGFAGQQFTQSWSSFSGGEKTRLNLARLLVVPRDVLLLDEPTNHLDFKALEWLEEYLAGYKGSVLVVSHDRRFLERVATRIVHLQDGRFQSYPGSYSQYLEQRAREEVSAQRAYEKQQEFIRRTEEYIRRFKAGIKSRQARGRQSQLNRLERLEKSSSLPAVNIAAPSKAAASAEIVLQADNLAKTFGARTILAEASITIRRGERLALVGPNGCGKTTLLQILAGALAPDAGEVRLGSRVRMAYFDQENENLRADNTVLDEIVVNCDLTPGEARSRLGAMLFRGDDVFKPVAALSGGERARLALLKMMIPAGNLLIMDEPTNHLDIDSRQAVEDLLAGYPGTLLTVSHDRYFLDQVTDSVLVIQGGRLVKYDGNYSSCSQRIWETKPIGAESPANPLPAQKSYRNRVSDEEKTARRLQRERAARIEQLESLISDLEAARSVVEEAMSRPESYRDEESARRNALDLQRIGRELGQALEEWEELMNNN